jgi:hypothetical protein
MYFSTTQKEGKSMQGLMGIEINYNGTIMVGQEKVQVKEGMATFQNQTFKVSKEGEVKDMQNQNMGRVDNGKFMPRQ